MNKLVRLGGYILDRPLLYMATLLVIVITITLTLRSLGFYRWWFSWLLNCQCPCVP